MVFSVYYITNHLRESKFNINIQYLSKMKKRKNGLHSYFEEIFWGAGLVIAVLKKYKQNIHYGKLNMKL